MIIKMYITLIPVILAGISNMVFTKTNVYQKYKQPMDGGRKLKDNERVFGENKTWIGFLSMIMFSMLIQVIWGMACRNIPVFIGKNYLYEQGTGSLLYDLLIGFLLGFAYMICELPNSFIKRRLKIIPGKTKRGVTGGIFFIIDQIDSIIGVTFVLCFFYPMPPIQFLLFLILGGATHISVNLILYFVKIRKNI